MTVRSVVLGCGSYLPRRILTNAELATRIDTSDEWIVQRTGIRERRIAAEGECTSHLAINAARAALADAGIDAQSIDLIVLATSTPDNTFPATAVAVQCGLGIHHGAAFDLQAVCSGFVFGIATADNFLRTGTYKRALVIGAETFSRAVDHAGDRPLECDARRRRYRIRTTRRRGPDPRWCRCLGTPEWRRTARPCMGPDPWSRGSDRPP